MILDLKYLVVLNSSLTHENFDWDLMSIWNGPKNDMQMLCSTTKHRVHVNIMSTFECVGSYVPSSWAYKAYIIRIQVLKNKWLFVVRLCIFFFFFFWPGQKKMIITYHCLQIIPHFVHDGLFFCNKV